jgi:hypothetical protein
VAGDLGEIKSMLEPGFECVYKRDELAFFRKRK